VALENKVAAADAREVDSGRTARRATSNNNNSMEGNVRQSIGLLFIWKLDHSDDDPSASLSSVATGNNRKEKKEHWEVSAFFKRTRDCVTQT
jgi:hypothetical protein